MDSGDIDDALAQKLAGDPILVGLMKNGIYTDIPSEGLSRFVLISLVEEADEPVFGGRAFEDALYLVKAVGLSTPQAVLPPDVMKQAAARIDKLLEDAVLIVPGYTCMTVFREARVRYAEVDDVNTSIRWFHRGGHYRVQMSVTP